MRYLIIFLALVLTSCGKSANYEKMAKKAVAKDFLDPASAQFRNIDVQSDFGNADVCGEVNAKNSYGAYTGFKPFLFSVSEDFGERVLFEESPSGKFLIDLNCKK